MNTYYQNNTQEADKNFIKHAGIVTKVTENSVFVKVLDNVNCAACHAKSSCGISEDNSKDVEIFENHTAFHLHENVNLIMGKELGLKAVFFAYVLPFFLLFTTLLISLVFFTEWQAGLLAMGILIPYYFLLYNRNNYMQKTFKISLSKQK